MISWLDHKYIGLLSPRFYNFKKRKDHYNLSCPLCQEYHTSSSKRKARCYILDSGQNGHVYCHRCGASMTIPQFIETIDPFLYQEYRKEKFLEFGKVKKPTFEVPKLDVKEILEDPFRRAAKVSRLPEDHYARQYAESRLIPSDRLRELYFVPKFGEWCNTFLDEKFESNSSLYDEPRLVIPFFNKQNKFHALQGRSFNPKSELRYLTLVLDETIPSVYGLNRVDSSKEIFVVEGPIDSMFLPNAIASAGGNLISKLDSFDKEKLTIIYDNESRSPTTVKKIQRAIHDGFKIVIWPKAFVFKDINDAIIGGLTKEKIVEIIQENTYKGLKANLALNSWRKC